LTFSCFFLDLSSLNLKVAHRESIPAAFSSRRVFSLFLAFLLLWKSLSFTPHEILLSLLALNYFTIPPLGPFDSPFFRSVLAPDVLHTFCTLVLRIPIQWDLVVMAPSGPGLRR